MTKSLTEIILGGIVAVSATCGLPVNKIHTSYENGQKVIERLDCPNLFSNDCSVISKTYEPLPVYAKGDSQ